MRQIGRVIILLVILLMLAVIVLPWADGYLFKQRCIELVNAINHSQQVRARIIDYQEHWLRSQIKLEVTIVNDQATTSLSDTPDQPMQLLIDNQVTHGPIVIDKAFGGLRFAYAGIVSTVTPPVNWHIIRPSQTIQMTALANFSHQWINKIDIPALRIALAIGNINWQGLTGTVYFDVDHGVIADIASRLTSQSILLTTKQQPPVTMLIDGFTYASSTSRQLTHLWDGNFTLIIPHVNINAANKHISVNQINLSNQMGIDDNQHYSFTNTLAIDSLLLPNSQTIKRLSTINAILKINNLNAKKADRLASYLSTTHAGNPSPLANQAYADLLTALFTPQTELTHTLSAKTNLGDLASQINVSFPSSLPQPASPITVVQAAEVNATFKIAAALLNQFFADTLSTDHPATATPMHSMLLQQTIQKWMASGYIISVGDDYVATIKRHKGQTLINGKPLILSTPDDAPDEKTITSAPHAN